MKFIEWDYDNNTVTEWYRFGYCNHCGECCKREISLKTCGESDVRAGGKCTDANGVWCQYGEGDSALYWKTQYIDHDRGYDCYGVTGCPKPKSPICAAWPLHPKQIEQFPQCSYWFSKVHEGDID